MTESVEQKSPVAMRAEEFMQNHNTLKADRGPHHKTLDAFTGHWKVRGLNGADTSEDGGEAVQGTEIYEWLEGKYFLINKWDRPSVSGPFKGLGWIGFDSQTGKYRSYSVSNTGYFRVYDVDVFYNQIKYTGEKERGTVKISSDRNTLQIHWEENMDGHWHTLCHLSGQRLH